MRAFSEIDIDILDKVKFGLAAMIILLKPISRSPQLPVFSHQFLFLSFGCGVILGQSLQILHEVNLLHALLLNRLHNSKITFYKSLTFRYSSLLRYSRSRLCFYS